MNYHPNAFTHEGYGGDDKVTGYHMDGRVIFFTAQFDDGKTDDLTLAGMPTETDNHYVQGAEISMPALTRRDYNLAGWTVTDRKSGETIAEIGADEKYRIDADVTFTALWEQKQEVVYVYYQAVDSNGTAFSKDTKLLTEREKRRAGIHPTGYGDDGWFVCGKMTTRVLLSGGEYTDPDAAPFRDVIAEMDGKFAPHKECSGGFFEKGYGSQIRWTLLKYHDSAYKHPGYSSDSDTGLVAYHMDGTVTFYNVQLDANAEGDTTVEGLSEKINGYYVETAELILPELTREGYTFRGWAVGNGEAVNGQNAGGELLSGGTEVTVHEDVTYTAQWKKQSDRDSNTYYYVLKKIDAEDGHALKGARFGLNVADSYWVNTAISTMAGLGIVQGRTATTFDPTAPITRAQFAAICARFDTGKTEGGQTFTDIQGHWAQDYIERAAELGWIRGFEDGTFRPDAYITRAQAMTMINRVLNRIPEDADDLRKDMNVWPDCNPGDWFYLAAQEATNSHDYKHKAGSYETWTGMNGDRDWSRYEN